MIALLRLPPTWLVLAVIHHLTTDVKPGHVVGVLLNRGALLPVALAGVMLSGAAYLPLDPTLPSERLQYMCRKADVRVVLSTAALASVVACRVVDVEHMPFVSQRVEVAVKS